jgi:hypothetical protein
MLITLDALTIIPQGSHEEWCWASITAGISQFIEGRAYTLNDVAEKVLPNCDGQGNPACEIPWPLADALDAMQHLDYAAAGSVALASIQQAITQQRRPVAIGITYSTTLGDVLHYCVIKGCGASNADDQLIILNPKLPDPCEYHLSYSDLQAGVLLQAIWTDSFYVK